MPKGIVSRLIVELHQYIAYQAPPHATPEPGRGGAPVPALEDPHPQPLSQNERGEQEDPHPQPLSQDGRGEQEEALVWKTGVLVTNGSALAEIKENYTQRSIEIRVSGNRQRDWLLPIAHELDKIHNSYENLQVQKLIPCNCKTCRTSPNPEFYPKQTLDKYQDDRRPDIECRKSYDRVNVRELLDDVVDERLYPDLARRDRRSGSNLDPSLGRPIEPSLPPPPQNPTLTTNQQGVTVIVQQNQENQPMDRHISVNNGDYVEGNKAGRDYIETQINNPSPSLVETAKEIKALLAEISEEYNPNTPKGQNLIKEEALKMINDDPTLKQRFINALKEGGATALEELVDHPVVKSLVAAGKGFMDA
ncbi:MAG: hypothetical protein ACO35Q_13715 [Prochlorothrix sp.]